MKLFCEKFIRDTFQMDEYISGITEILLGRLHIPKYTLILRWKYNEYKIWIDRFIALPEFYHSPETLWHTENEGILTILLVMRKTPSLFRHIFSLANNISKMTLKYYNYHNIETKDFYEYEIYDINMEIIRIGFDTYVKSIHENITIENFGFTKLSEKVKPSHAYKIIKYQIEK